MLKRLALVVFLVLTSCSTLLPPPSGSYTPPTPSNLFSVLPHRADNKETLYAVLIGAHTELRHRGNLSIAYQTLIERGYKPKNIFILDSGGPVPWYPYTDATTKSAMRLLFTRLAHVVEKEDQLLVYITGHGRYNEAAIIDGKGNKQKFTVNTLQLNASEQMTQKEFERLINAIKPKYGFLIYDHCYWGLIDVDCRFIVVSASSEDKPTHGVKFSRALWNALRQGKTIKEAFEEALVASPKDKPNFRVCNAR